MNTNFSIKEAYKWAWQKFKEHLQFLLVMVIVIGAVQVILDKLSSGEQENVFLLLIYIVFSVVSSIGVFRVALNIHNNVKPQVQDFFISLGLFWRYLVIELIVIVLVALGILALIIPGLYILSRLQFAIFTLVNDRPHNPIDALKKSWAITKGNVWNVFVLLLSISLINLIGALPLGFGLLVTVPVSLLVLVFVFKKLEMSFHQSDVSASILAEPEINKV